MSRRGLAAVLMSVVSICARPVDVEPLRFWNQGPVRTAILDFVNRVTDESSPDFVLPEDRIAVFDNDGTLWSEQPVYFQLAFAFNRVKAESDRHPEWKEQQPFKAILEGDLKSALAGGEKAIAEVLAATHAGMTTEEFDSIVKEWLATARHPRFRRPYTDLVFQPMLELLEYLRRHGFKTYIVSGGGVDFLRAFSDKLYGIPSEQVIDTTGKLKYAIKDGTPVLMKLPEVEFIDDGPGKPAGIHRFIGRRPIMAFGNSDGDLQMLQWTTAGKGARFALLVHHTDAEREWSYDRESQVGKLDKALDEATKASWVVADMKADWRTVYPFQK